MIVGVKDILKMTSIMIICFCAVFVCAMFMNYYIDINAISDIIQPGEMKIFYEAQVMTCKVVCYVTGGCLFATSIVMLIFYIKKYIDSHSREIGILKALGYSNIKIALGFWSFGLSVCVGTVLGVLGAFAMMPAFYKVQAKDGILPDVSVTFHYEILIYFILLPTVFFSLLAVVVTLRKLHMQLIELLKGKSDSNVKKAGKETDKPFLKELQKSTLRQKKTLVFFMAFAAFCYSAMLQMSIGMDRMASRMMAVMMLAIGIVLAVVTLILAMTTVINSNTKTIAMMKVFGYSLKECSRAILSGYRPIAYIGFVLGTLYQYILLKVMVTVVFKDVGDIPEYNFDVKAFIIALVSFAILYELVMYVYTNRIKKLTLKEVME